MKWPAWLKVGRDARSLVIWTLALVALHWTLGRALDGADFMGALSAARHGHVGVAAAFALYLLVRLVVVVGLPSLLLARAGAGLHDRFVRARTRSSASCNRS